jgi:hypothetical protein
VAVHPRECQLLAQCVAVAIVGVDVDRALIEERLIQTVEPFPNPLLLALDLGNLLRVALEFAPCVEHATRSRGEGLAGPTANVVADTLRDRPDVVKSNAI